MELWLTLVQKYVFNSYQQWDGCPCHGSPTDSCLVAVISRATLIVADALVLVITWRATHKVCKVTGETLPLTHILLRDGDNLQPTTYMLPLYSCTVIITGNLYFVYEYIAYDAIHVLKRELQITTGSQYLLFHITLYTCESRIGIINSAMID